MADGTYSVICAVRGTGGILIYLNVPIVNLGIEDLYLFNSGTAFVSAVDLLKTVGLCKAICIGDYFFFAPESVRFRVNSGFYGLEFAADDTFVNVNADGYAVSSNHIGMPADHDLPAVLAGDRLTAQVTSAVTVFICALRESLAAQVTFVIAVGICALGESLAARITLVIVIVVLARGQCLRTDIALVIAVLILTLAVHLAAHVAFM